MQTYRHDRLIGRLFLPLIPDTVRPNQITVLRLLSTPFVVWTIWAQRYDLGIPLFLLVAFTDALDGSLARLRNQVTEWGMVWDPIADKVLIGSVAVVLLYQDFPVDIAIIIFGLEAIFLTGGYYRKRQGRIVSANRWGKLKMLLQVTGITLYMCAIAFSAPALALASYVVLLVATLFAVFSLFTHGL